MKNAINNLEKFKFVVSSMKENEKHQEALKNQCEVLLKTLLKESPELFEDALYKWAKNNPIEAISYIYAYNFGTKEIYFKNDSSYQKLFTNDGASIHDKDITFTLYDKKTLEGKSFCNGEITKHFSRLENEEGRSLVLDLLDDYKVDLIKDKGKYIDEQNWTTEINVVNSVIPVHEMVRLLDKNFTLNVLNIKYNDVKNNISFSKNGVSEFTKSHLFDFFGRYKDDCVPQNVYLILNDNSPVGLIEFDVYEDKEIINLEAIEFPEEYQRLGYGTHAIDTLQTIFPACLVQGYSGENEDRCAFFANIGAEYLSCEDCCDEYGCSCDRDETDDYGCDEPYDYQFVIQPYRC